MGAAALNQISLQGYQPGVVECYQQGVRCISPPYLVALLHPVRHYRPGLELYPAKAWELMGGEESAEGEERRESCNLCT